MIGADGDYTLYLFILIGHWVVGQDLRVPSQLGHIHDKDTASVGECPGPFACSSVRL